MTGKPTLPRNIEPATVLVGLLATLSTLTSSGVGEHYFGALMIDRVSRTTWLLAALAVLIMIWRPFGRRTPDGRAKVYVLSRTASGWARRMDTSVCSSA